MGERRSAHRQGDHGRARRLHRAPCRRAAGSNRLHPSDTTTSIRRSSDDGVAISDGAFAETKEVIGRYYLIDAADLDEALRIAVQVPAPFGGVEVRPVQKTG